MSNAELVTREEVETTDLHEVTEQAPMMQAIETPEGISPLLQMIGSGQYDLETIKQLVAIRDNEEARDAKAAYNRAMAQFRIQLEPAKRSGNNTHLSSFYATFDDLLSAVSMPLGNNGINVSFVQEQPQNKIVRITCTLTHELGHSESSTLEHPVESQKGINSLQELGLTVSYLKRYTLSALTGVATEDSDGQMPNDPPPPAPRAKIEPTAELIKDFNKHIDRKDGNALISLSKLVGQEMWIALFNSGANGDKVRIKEDVRKLMSEAHEIISATHTQLAICMDKDTVDSARELLDETPWPLIEPP